ncbi:MAG TPA: glycosyl hydrolase, partial [Bryobacteraceae bacterium]|nr:glycosyl hydrolase [Bryobacteraceae bacterium]
GAVIAGPKPTDDPSEADDQAEFAKLSSELFGDGAGVHRVGQGTVYAGQSLGDAFAALGVKPDFDCAKAEMEFVHRRLTDGDIYFVDNRSDQGVSIEATFRVSGKQPELWHAETGTSEPTSFKIADGRTSVPLRLEPWGTVFVVFDTSTTETSFVVLPVRETSVATLSGPWTVQFEAGRGAPASTTMDALSDWSKSADPGVKYFSGAATYTNTVQASPEWFRAGARLWLDLGDVKNLAVLTVNGKEVGEAWHAPYRLDVTSTLKPGANEIKVMVVNAWVNRLIGDEQPKAAKITFADVKPYKASSPLAPSGLLGPVTVVSTE